MMPFYWQQFLISNPHINQIYRFASYLYQIAQGNDCQYRINIESVLRQFSASIEVKIY